MKPIAKRVNLKTSPEDIFHTILAELPSVEYFFRKNYGGKNRYHRVEEEMLDKAIEEKKDQLTAVNEHISSVGNRWMSYTHVEYFPKALYAVANHVSFIYYETYASCGAFFPLYAPATERSEGKPMKKRKNNGIIGVIFYTDHFFLRMADRTGKKYRSRELIQEFITTRNLHAMQADEDGDVAVKFRGGYGFGKWRQEGNVRVYEVRTYLNEKGRDSLTGSQRRKVEKLNAYAELIDGGMYNPDVRLHTAAHFDPNDPETKKRTAELLKSVRSLGVEKEINFKAAVSMAFVSMLGELLNMKLTQQQINVVMVLAGEECNDITLKYANRDMSNAPEPEQQEFINDFVEFSLRVAKKMKLRSITKEKLQNYLKRKSKESVN